MNKWAGIQFDQGIAALAQAKNPREAACKTIGG